MTFFFKNFSKLLGANVIAQVVLTLSLPLITYLYSPEQFGRLGVIIAIASLLSILASFKLDNYILTFPESNYSFHADILAILKITLINALPFLVITGVVLSYFDLDVKYNISLIEYCVIFFFSVLLAWNNTFSSALVRSNKIQAVAISALLRAAILVVSQAFFGMLGMIYGLIISEVLSRCCTATYLYINVFRKKKHKSSQLQELLIRAKSFPTFVMPANLISNLVVQAPILFSAYIFDAKVAGIYFMANRIVSIPTSMISASLSKVIVPTIINKTKTQAKTLLVKLVSISFICIVICCSVAFLIIDYIALYEPESWKGIFEVTQVFLWTIPFIISVSSISQVFNIYNAQRRLLLVDIARSLIVIATLIYLTYKVDIDLLYYTILIVLSICLGYLVQLYFIIKTLDES